MQTRFALFGQKLGKFFARFGRAGRQFVHPYKIRVQIHTRPAGKNQLFVRVFGRDFLRPAAERARVEDFRYVQKIHETVGYALGKIDAVFPRALRFGGAGGKAFINLARIGGHNNPARLPGEFQREFGFSGGGRAAEDDGFHLFILLNLCAEKLGGGFLGFCKGACIVFFF